MHLDASRPLPWVYAKCDRASPPNQTGLTGNTSTGLREPIPGNALADRLTLIVPAATIPQASQTDSNEGPNT
jgi:hypothetical protein